MPLDTTISGEVLIVLPPLNLRLIDLSMDNLLLNTYIGADGRLISFVMDLGETETSVATFIEFMMKSWSHWKKIHEIYQKKFDNEFLIGGDK
jgi:hypothetical protein